MTTDQTKELRATPLQSDGLLISRRDIDTLARPCLADDREAERFIAEAEQIDIAPQIGTDVYLRIKESPRDFEDLLTGGVWRDECGRTHIFGGLRVALAYYAYARIVKNGGHVASRFGYTEKRDEYSSHVELKQRTAEANDAYAVAVEHLRGCVKYINANPKRFGVTCAGSSVKNTTTPRYRVIKS